MKLFSLLILTLQNPFREFTKLMQNQFAFGFPKEVHSHKLSLAFTPTFYGRLLRSQGGGGHFKNFWVGGCRWDPGTLDLYRSDLYTLS